MKVLVIVPEIVTYGGTVRFLEHLLDLHLRQGLKTALLVPDDQHHVVLCALAQQYGVELVSFSNRISPRTAPFLTPFLDLVFSWPAILSQRPDLVVVSTSDPGRMSCVLYVPVPVLYILHSTPEKRFRLLPRWYMRIGSMLRNRIMTVSMAAANTVAETMGIPRARIAVVHNSCPIKEASTESSGKPIVLTVGHMVDYKNPWLWLEVACKVLATYPDTLFVWLGDGELLESVRDKVRQRSLEERVLLPGYVEDPSEWYLRASVYFQPSIRESHGIAVLEAMAHGLPCVVSDTGGLPESVVNKETGYVCPLANLDCFTTAVMELLEDFGLRSKMGEAGRQRVDNLFSEKKQEDKLMSLYCSLVQKDEG